MVFFPELTRFQLSHKLEFNLEISILLSLESLFLFLNSKTKKNQTI